MNRPLPPAPIAAVLLILATACGSAPAGGGATALSCPGTLPDCPATPPTYADVAPIFSAHCLSCHSGNGVASSRDLSTYAAVYPQRSSILSQVHACLMPPYNGVALSEADYTLLVSWLVCRAPQ